MNVKFRVYRYNPEDKRSWFDEFEFDAPRGMTILEGLQYIKDNIDPTLSFRAFCRSGICGSCAVKVNGFPKLSCKTQISMELEKFGGNELTIEPLDNMPVIRDLVVDWDVSLNRMFKTNPYLLPDNEVVPKTLNEESRVYPDEIKKFESFTDCILCGACYSACGIVKADEDFAGPFAFARICRFAADPRDALRKERSKIAFGFDMWNCVRCQRCVNVCPKNVSPVDAIMKLRGMSMDIGLKNNPGARHAIAFYKSILKTGLLNEALLPIESRGVKAVFENLSTGVKMLFKGKLPTPFPSTIEDHEGLVRVMKEAMEVNDS